MDLVRVKVISLDHFGNGIGKIDNKVVFIQNALDKEVVDVEITSDKKNYMISKCIKVIDKSIDRVNPICPYYNICGGCNLQHMSYSKQLDFKYNKVKNIMYKYAKIDNVNDIVPSPDIYNYRNKANFKVDNKIGFNTKKSNKVVEIEECYLLNHHINRLIPTLNEMNIKKECIVKSGNTDMIVVDDRVINNETIIYEIDSKKYRVSKNSFFQVNLKQAYNMFEKIKNYVNNDDVLDLYCGVGSIGIYVSDNAKSVLGIEIVKEAIIDAQYNKELNNITNISFKCGDVGNILEKNNFKPSLVIVDPPRNGLDKKTIEELIKIRSNKIIYVSCDPMTLARDLSILNKYYNIENVTPFDMFPNTYHVECVCVMNLR